MLYIHTYLPAYSEKILVDDETREPFRRQLLEATPHVLSFLATMQEDDAAAGAGSGDKRVATQVGR